VLVPFWASRDTVVQEDVRTAMVRSASVTSITRPLMPDEIMALTSSASIVIGMRLHSLIAAVAMAVPHVAIDYSEKVRNFLVEVHGEDAAKYRVDPGCKAEELVAVVRRIQANHGALEQGLEIARKRLQKRETYNAGAFRQAAT
jgi:polysaccharide pyruvyl transferase WcaK-like protein